LRPYLGAKNFDGEDVIYRPTKYVSKLVPVRVRSVVSDELVCQVMSVGHVAAMTQVTVATHSALPANTTYGPPTTLATYALVTHT